MRTKVLFFLPALVLGVVVPATPAGAGAAAPSISVTPTTARPTESVTVTGTSDCASVAYTVTLTYTNPDGDPATATASGTTDASGEYTQPITVPENAVAGEDASVQSSVDCSGGAAGSNTVDLTVAAWQGTLAVSPTSGPAGTEVTISGTLCYGDDIIIALIDSDDELVDEVTDVTLNDDRTFSASYTIPDDLDARQYDFVAECPGSDFEAAGFTVTSAGGQPTDDDEDDDDTGAATAVRGRPSFTG
ncbi:MAG TPA: hypothetical protein VM938_05995 [Acidimicrobiales bacterium]|nr:hypothetical protein [Acidimicrobiales bacterium]